MTTSKISKDTQASSGTNLSPANWRGGPPICAIERLPALDTLEALDKFHAANSPASTVVKKWPCVHCHKWHAYCVGPDPGGGSSGTGRSKKVPGGMEGYKAFFKAKSPVEMFRFFESDEAKKAAEKQARK